jgi:membrane protein involved in colicin uptake
MSYWITGAIVVGSVANAAQAERARKDARTQQTLMLQQQQADAEMMRQRISDQTESYRQQGASLQQQADLARQSFEQQQLQYAENKLAMEAKAREVQAATDAERRKAAASEASAIRARTRGGRRSLLSQERMDAELGIPVDLSAPMRLQ